LITIDDYAAEAVVQPGEKECHKYINCTSCKYGSLYHNLWWFPHNLSRGVGDLTGKGRSIIIIRDYI
jgi:hypothetical protein